MQRQSSGGGFLALASRPSYRLSDPEDSKDVILVKVLELASFHFIYWIGT